MLLPKYILKSGLPLAALVPFAAPLATMANGGGLLTQLHRFQSDAAGTAGATDGATWSPDNAYLAVSDNRTTTRIFNAGNPVWTSPLRTLVHLAGSTGGSSGEVNAVSWSSDGLFVATGVDNGGVKIWNASTGAQLHHLHNGYSTDGGEFSPDGNWYAAGANGELRVYDVKDAFSLEYTLFTGTPGEINAVSWTRDSNRIVIGSNTGTAQAQRIRVIDRATQQVLQAMPSSGSVKKVAVSPDNVLVAMGARDRLCQVFNLNTGALVANLKQLGNTTPLPGDDNDTNPAVEAVAWSNSGRYLFSSGLIDGVMRVWRREDWSLVGWVQAQEAKRAIETISLSTDDRVMVGGDEGYTYIYQFTEPMLPDRFAPAAGLVSIEAEDYDSHVAQGGHQWSTVGAAAASGGAALEATGPAAVKATTYQSYDPAVDSPKLDYRVRFAEAGTYYVWIRGLGDASANSVHVGIGNEPRGTARGISFSGGASVWSWGRLNDGGVAATLSVPSAGDHTVHVWMRESGTKLDKIVLTRSSTYDPSTENTGRGPAPTARAAAYSVPRAADGFESNTFSGGTGWAAAWTTSANGGATSADLRTQDDGLIYPVEGAYMGRVRGAASMSRTLSLSGATEARLLFSWATFGLDSATERVVCEVNGGAGWVEVAALEFGTSPYTWFRENIDLSAFAPSSTVQVRFKITGNSSTDIGYVDNVSVRVVEKPTTVAGDGFETNTFSGGTGWAGAWTTSANGGTNNADLRTQDDGLIFPATGSYMARVRGQASMSRTVNLTGATGASLVFSWATFGLDSAAERVVCEVNDGSGWTQVSSLEYDSTPYTWFRDSVDLSSFTMSASFQVRFRVTGNSSTDIGYIDDVAVTKRP